MTCVFSWALGSSKCCVQSAHNYTQYSGDKDFKAFYIVKITCKGIKIVHGQ